MTEHKGTSFVHSCVKVPVDPYSRQPTPQYERPRLSKKERKSSKNRKINFSTGARTPDVGSPRESFGSFLEFIESIPDYGDVHHLSNEQFKQKLDYLKRKQRLLLKNLRECLERDEDEEKIVKSKNEKNQSAHKVGDWNSEESDLMLKGKRCSLEVSRCNSPLLYSSATFAGLADDQDLLTYRCKSKEKAEKTLLNQEILSAGKYWSSGSDSKSGESIDSDPEISVETKSLPSQSPRRWNPTLPKPFSFTLREDAEKYMSAAEKEADELARCHENKKPPVKKHARPIPLTSKLPLYDKLMAAKEERSRMIREESALNLMSLVRPFKLECDRRALRALTRSSPELSAKRIRSASRFKAKPVPKNLFTADIYDRMLENEYFRHLQKRLRAAELMKMSSLPPSMARRERCKSAKNSARCGRDTSSISCITPLHSERSRSALTSSLNVHGNNLAAILRCQASREKLEREIQDRLEDERREQTLRFRKAIIGQKPAWKALRSAARHEHERDLDFRATLRRDEAREQAERHRLQMEMMLDRVTQIPTLFERHSQVEKFLQSFGRPSQSKNENSTPSSAKKSTKKSSIIQSASSVDSYGSLVSSRPNSGSFSSSSGTLATVSRSSKSSGTAKSEKKKSDRGTLKVSINEKAELIEDKNDYYEEYSMNSTPSKEREEREKCTLAGHDNDADEKHECD